MSHPSNRALIKYRNEVGIRFQLYNSLFTSLPFHRIEKTGILLSLLSSNCEEGYKKNLSPIRIIDEFFTKHTSYVNEKDKTDLLFRFVQYLERQVVLFDALEDASFGKVIDLNGVGTLKHLESEVLQQNKQDELAALALTAAAAGQVATLTGFRNGQRPLLKTLEGRAKGWVIGAALAGVFWLMFALFKANGQR